MPSTGAPSEIKDVSLSAGSLPAGVILMGSPNDRLHITFPSDAVAPTWIARELKQSAHNRVLPVF